MITPYLSIIIPAYNEKERILPTLEKIIGYLEKQDYSYEVIVVDDGSTDKTREVVIEYSKKITVIRNNHNKGKGNAVKKGMLEAKGEVRFFVDADNSTSIEHLEKMLPCFNEGFSVVIGSRGMQESELAVRQSGFKQEMGKIGIKIIQLLVVSGISDTQCGFKGFTGECAEKIFGVSSTDGWAFDVEVLYLAGKFGFTVKEVPVRWVNDFASKVKWYDYFLTLFEVFLIRYRWWSKR